MSLVYAINDVDMVIMSDTKIGLQDDFEKLWSSEKDFETVKLLGLIKSIIVSPHLVICFAGNNISKAAELLQDTEKYRFNKEQLVKRAYDIHMSSGEDEIEFIIATCGEIKEIITIKNRTIVRNCKRAWIGSIEAYKELSRQEEKILNSSIGKNTADNDEFDTVYTDTWYKTLSNIYKMEVGFNRVVDSGVDSSVGGMSIRIKIPEGESHFEYMSGLYSHSSSWKQIIPPNQSIRFLQGAEMGSFSCNIYQSSNKVCCYVYENDMGIVYTDDVCYSKKLQGMMFPQIYHMKENEFIKIAENYGAYPCISFE